MPQPDLPSDVPDQFETCPLCGGRGTAPLASVAGRDYLDCADCRLAFMAPAQRLPLDSERAHYRLHRNAPTDAGYRRFLAKLAEPLIPLLRRGARGLDYGCGPGPTLSVMLRQAGMDVRDYDPCFAPDPAALSCDYDFITCTETVEHFHHPGREFARLDELLRPSGCLAVMTETLGPDVRFSDWWYLRDPTHVCFYRPETMRWIAGWRNWRMISPRGNVTFFFKH